MVFVEKTGITSGVTYAISKAGSNILVAKFAAELRDEWVNTQDPNAPGTLIRQKF